MSEFDKFDDENYPRGESDFGKIIDSAISRRTFVKSSTLAGLSAFFTKDLLGMSKGEAKSELENNGDLISFSPIPISTKDTVMVPDGYEWETLIAWGDPLMTRGSKVKAFNQETRGTAASQKKAFGDNNDGMALFPISRDRAVMAVNNEYVNPEWLLVDKEVLKKSDANKVMMAQGVSVFEVEKVDGRWKVVVDAPLNRRITMDTPMEIRGPARGHKLLKTKADPRGVKSLGTWNNCGNGETPWGTYLTCEENFNGYFKITKESAEPTEEQNRYGVGKKGGRYSLYKYDKRFDVNYEPNEANRAGYVVEIDPKDPKSTPKKRTALGRFKHENAEVTVAKNGQVVVYLGDDERGEYLYKFISKNKYQAGNKRANKKLLDEGTLYVAKFGEADDKLKGRGEWIPLIYGERGLTKENGISSQAEISIFTRKAGDIVGATTMDRPEWVAVHPNKVEAYCSLTNNKNRGKKKNAGGIEQLVNGPNPRNENNYGQVLKWIPDNQDHTSDKFSWSLFVMAGNPIVKDGIYAGSENINKDNMFNSPDGMSFDSDGRLWIQTDGNYSNKGDFEGMGNNQMLCAHPDTGEIKRFLVGPVSCEMTGFSWSPDNKTMFVGIQHPGKTFPGTKKGDVPRSSVVAIWKKDGGAVGT